MCDFIQIMNKYCIFIYANDIIIYKIRLKFFIFSIWKSKLLDLQLLCLQSFTPSTTKTFLFIIYKILKFF